MKKQEPNLIEFYLVTCFDPSTWSMYNPIASLFKTKIEADAICGLIEKDHGILCTYKKVWLGKVSPYNLRRYRKQNKEELKNANRKIRQLEKDGWDFARLQKCKSS